MFFVFLPVLDLYSGKYNAFHRLCHLKNIKDTCVSHVEFQYPIFSSLSIVLNRCWGLCYVNRGVRFSQLCLNIWWQSLSFFMWVRFSKSRGTCPELFP